MRQVFGRKAIWRFERDAYGRVIRRKPLFEKRVKKLRALSNEELDELIRNKQLREFLEISGGLGSKIPVPRKDDNILTYLIAAEKREIRGTTIGDALKLIVAGRIDKLKKNPRVLYKVLNVLEVAGIAKPREGKIDIPAVKKCLEENRIVWK